MLSGRVGVVVAAAIVSLSQGFLFTKPVWHEALQSVDVPVAAVPEVSSEGGLFPPILCIPGLTSSNLTYSLHNAASAIPDCPTDLINATLWPSPVPKTLHEYRCLLQNYGLYYDKATGTIDNRPNETVVVPDYLSFSSDALPTSFWTTLGWTVGKNLVTAAFDWRYTPADIPEYYDRLKALVEETYENNNQQRVVLLAVSWGPQPTLAFLHKQEQAWKDKYIAWFIAQSPIWSGAPMAVESLVSGFDAGTGQRELTRVVAQGAGSLLSLFPRPGTSNVTYGDDEVIVETPSKRYVSANLSLLLEDLGMEDRIDFLDYARTEPTLDDFANPGVNTFVAFGYNVSTPGYFRYDGEFVRNSSVLPELPAETGLLPETGDSLVPFRSSMRGWYAWKDTMRANNHTLLYKKYLNQPHAYCILPWPYNKDGCFEDVLAIIRHNRAPKDALDNMS